MSTYKDLWITKEHGVVACNVVRAVDNEHCVIRIPDPYDAGEIELTVSSLEISKKEGYNENI